MSRSHPVEDILGSRPINFLSLLHPQTRQISEKYFVLFWPQMAALAGVQSQTEQPTSANRRVLGLPHRVLGKVYMILGVQHRVPGLLHRVLGVPHRALGYYLDVRALHRVRGFRGGGGMGSSEEPTQVPLGVVTVSAQTR